MGVGASKQRKPKPRKSKPPTTRIRNVPNHVLVAQVAPHLAPANLARWTMAYKGSPASKNERQQTMRDLDQVTFYGTMLMMEPPEARSRWMTRYPPPRAVTTPAVNFYRVPSKNMRVHTLITPHFEARLQGYELLVKPSAAPSRGPVTVVYRPPSGKATVTPPPRSPWPVAWMDIVTNAVKRAGARLEFP